MLFGHRGYSSLAPENTLAAFRLLLERGIPGVELDVQLASDGRAVVIHDETLDRTTSGSGPVGEKSTAELRRLDAGSWFSPRFTGEKIPLLDEVFELLGDRVYYDLEMKTRQLAAGALETEVIRLIRTRGLEDRCLISSFNPASVRAARKLAPFLPAAHIYSRSRRLPFLLRHGEAALVARVQFIKPDYRLVSSRTVRCFRLLAGCETIAWSVDDPAAAAGLAAVGVRGLISRDPGGIRAALPGGAAS